MHKLSLIIILCCITAVSFAIKPKFLYNIDFATYFDNREYDETYQIPQTIFSFRLSPEVGVGFKDSLGGSHKVIAGVHYTQPLGGNWSNVNFSPTAYYQYKYNGFTIALGAVPYKERIERLPDFLQYDSTAYAHPNVQGALFSYQSKWGFAEFMCDWHGSQSPTRREMFQIVVNGRFQYEWFECGGFAQLNHKANFAKPTQREGVCDDVYINPQIGFNVSKYTPFDSLSVRVGYILGIQNCRWQESYKKPQGLFVELFANWKFLGIKNTLYWGDNLMPHYRVIGVDGEFLGSDLNQGDPFYQSKFYNRTDIFAYLFRNHFVNCFFSWNLHVDDTFKLQHQQQVVVLFSLDEIKNKGKKMRGLSGK